ncbi:MAG: glycosyltransferase family 4 protein [Gemmataceae bacterium]|nr:glycosyltransferase family 4 protein [Gemmataceae bacterium]
MRIIGLVESTSHVCCRYRLRAFVDGFAEQGIKLELRPLGSGITRWRSLADVRDADVVVLQRKLLPSWELDRLRRHSRRLIFDFDDAVFCRDSYHPRGQESSKHRARFEATVRAFDAVVAGNPWLAEQALQAGADRPISIPTCVDPENYHPASHAHSDPGLTMVWVGSSSTLQGLELQRVLLETLGLRVPGLKLRVVCDQEIHFKHLPVENHKWSEADEAAAIVGADVGLSLLPDDEWSRGKCGLKVLQYMAAGLPVVGNPVGVTADLIGKPEDPFRAGILASTADEFVAALESLRPVAARQSLGRVARQRVIERFSVKTGLRRWLGLLKDLAEARQAG